MSSEYSELSDSELLDVICGELFQNDWITDIEFVCDERDDYDPMLYASLIMVKEVISAWRERRS